MAAIDIYKLEAFFYKVITERIKACETIGEVTNIYGSNRHLQIRSVLL
nr:MAG TPA: hypothetical protein [Caudoviricetes sp.]